MYKSIDKKVVLISLASISLIGAPLSASALDFESLLRSYLGTGGTGNLNQNLVKTNINTREAQIESEISAGVTAGQLNMQEENDLRAELNRIETLEGQYLSDGNLTNVETQQLVDELTNLTTRMQTYLTNSATTGTGTANYRDWFRRYGGPTASGSKNQAERQAHLDTRQAELNARIEQGVTSGRLNANESSRLRAELNKIANDETAALADGRLSYNEQQQLLASLDTLNNKITQEMSDQNWRRRNRHGGGINQQQSLLRQRINAGIRSGKLTRSEANSLLFKEQQIADLEARLRGSGGGLSFQESRRLNQELAQLSRDVSRQLADKDVW